MPKVALIGTGYVGQAFLRHLPLGTVVFATREDTASSLRFGRFLRHHKIETVINAAGFSGADANEDNPAKCYEDNLIMPYVAWEACKWNDIPMGHVSTGCLYDGSHGSPEHLDGDFDFRFGSSVYSGTKQMAEKLLDGAHIWRIRMPFDGSDHPGNLLVKLSKYPRLVDSVESVTNLDDFALWAIESLKQPADTWHMVNGDIRITRIAELLRENGLRSQPVTTFRNEVEYHHCISAPRSSCTLDNGKLKRLIGNVRPVEEAIIQSIYHLRDTRRDEAATGRTETLIADRPTARVSGQQV